MIPRAPIRGVFLLAAALLGVGCSGAPSASTESSVIDPPAQCAVDRPDCSVSSDFPDAGELNSENSAGLRFSDETGALVLDRFVMLPDSDGDGVPDDADDCEGTPDWVTCDGDPSNDGVYATVFYDPSGSGEASQRRVFPTTAGIPQVDIYFLIDATPTLSGEIDDLRNELTTIVDAVRAEFDDAQFGIGVYRAYPLDPLAAPYSQSPYHHVLDLTDDDSLLDQALSTIDTVRNTPLITPTPATQALYSVASGLGLGDMVPNRAACADEGEVGYPCFRENSLRIVMNVTDSEVFNGPQATGDTYGDPPFEPGVGLGSDLPPAEMVTDLFESNDASTAVDLGDLSGRSLTLLGMSNLLTDAVKTELAPGCAPDPPMDPDPPVDPDPPPPLDMDDKDVVLALRFDTPPSMVGAFANNTHWPAANVALFDDPLLDPTLALDCDGGEDNVGAWGAISWAPAASQRYFLVIDGVIPGDDVEVEPEGAFSISIVHDGDPADASWRTTDAPVAWTDVETALLGSDIRVASVVTLRDAMTAVSDGAEDARQLAAATDALTADGESWVRELASDTGVGLGAAVAETLLLPSTESVYDVSVIDLDNESTPIDERDFVSRIRADDCATDDDDAFQCQVGIFNRCRRCEINAELDYAISFLNDSVPPTTTSQVFDLEAVVRLDQSIEIERVPVRVLVPDAASHEFETSAGPSYYTNSYDTTARCNTPPERPRWSDLTWSGSTPEGTSIVFEIRTANTEAELDLATPAIVEVPTDTDEPTFNISDELIADGLPYGLPYLRITAVLEPSTSPPATPVLEGWSFEFYCEAAE